ncbi:MAG: hypothetical protein H6814_09280 [Phycisphaeraceae bacterium]|nr:hypothetical protein [Phycisphaeraceae bacterium]
MCHKHATPRWRDKIAVLAVNAITLIGPAQSAQPAPAPDVPGPEAALTAYQTIEPWIRSAAIPQAAAPIDLPGCTAISVTLRRGGRVVGRGTEVIGPDEPAARALRDAAAGAWIEASERIRGDNDALRGQRLRSDAAALTIDLELAGQWTPIGGESFADAGDEADPGIEGVAARVGDRLVAVFAGSMQSSNRDAAQALLAAAGALDLPPLPLKQLRDSHGLVVYRFPASRLTQITPGSAPVFLFRGGRVTPATAVTSGGLRAFSDRIAGNILRRHWPGPEHLGLMDTLRPWAGDYADPVIAAPRSQALASMALTRWALQRQSPKAPLAAVGALLEELADVQGDEAEPSAEPTSAAMTLCAINEADRAGVWNDIETPKAITRLRFRCRAAVAGAIDSADSIEPPALALVAYAAATDGTIDRSATEQVVRALFRESPAQELPALSPWLGWAELALHPAGTKLPAAIALREHRSILWRFQVPPVGAAAPDLVGAIIFTASRHPAPNWQTARALSLVATMLADPRLTSPDERLPEIVRLTRAMRFLMELTIDETDAALVPMPAATATGAVRMSLSDQRAPLDAAAMTLLTVCETIRAIDTVEADR